MQPSEYILIAEKQQQQRAKRSSISSREDCWIQTEKKSQPTIISLVIIIMTTVNSLAFCTFEMHKVSFTHHISFRQQHSLKQAVITLCMTRVDIIYDILLIHDSKAKVYTCTSSQP